MSAKALLVTGASRGIGRACALLAGRNGWAVGVNYREDAKAADALVEAIVKSGGRAIALKGDIAVEADVLGMFDAATKALGPLSVVIANAGIVAPTARLAEMSVERMRRLRGQRARRLPHRPRGHAANVKVLRRRGRVDRHDVIGRRAPRLAEPLCRLCRVQGRDRHADLRASQGTWRRGRQVNAIRPGLIETDIHVSGGEPDRARILGATAPMGRPGTAEEIAEAAVWLISDAASYVTGALLDVSGGR